MFDFTFTEAADSPVPVRINGTVYPIPRFTLKQFSTWTAIARSRQLEEALREVKDPKDRAQVVMYLDEVPVDVARVAQQLRTDPGVIHVIRTCFKGIVPDAHTERILEADPLDLLAIADALSASKVVSRWLKEDAGQQPGEETPDPKPLASDGSNVSLATGGKSSPDTVSPTE